MKYAVTALLFATCALCQETQPDRVTVPFSDASRPRVLKCSLLNGAISVKGYDGKDVIVEARQRTEARHQTRPTGMHRIDVNTTGLSVEEAENVVTVGTRAFQENIDVSIQVPYATSLKLHATNGGDIIVD